MLGEVEDDATSVVIDQLEWLVVEILSDAIDELISLVSADRFASEVDRLSDERCPLEESDIVICWTEELDPDRLARLDSLSVERDTRGISETLEAVNDVDGADDLVEADSSEGSPVSEPLKDADRYGSVERDIVVVTDELSKGD